LEELGKVVGACIVGLKPTWGLVPYTGCISLEATIDHAGPMARTVQDCATLLRVLGFLLWSFVRFLFRRLLKLLLRKKEESRRDDSFAFPDGRGGSSYMNSMRQMYGRRPFRTTHGYVGLGPADMTGRDIVCIIYGAQVPYVLRPDGNNQFQLVG
jgi:hypothetical protein